MVFTFFKNVKIEKHFRHVINIALNTKCKNKSVLIFSKCTKAIILKIGKEQQISKPLYVFSKVKITKNRICRIHLAEAGVK